MQCFIGLHLHEPLASDIIDVQHRWQDLGMPPADFHKHTNPHITLVPPFECKRPKGLAAELGEIGANFPSFAIMFASVQAFNRRILHLSVDSNATVELRARLLEASAEFARIHDGNAFFHPHSTLGYTNEPLTPRLLNDTQQKLRTALALPRRQEVTSFILYGRPAAGQDYQVVAEVPLSGNS